MSNSSPNALLQASSLQRHRPSLTQSRKTKIAQKLFDCMHRSAEPHKSFICQNDLDDIWRASKNIKKVLVHEDWTEAEVSTIRKKFTKILSIIILINSSDCIRRFRTLFFDTLGSQNARTDDEIPFTVEQLSILDISTRKLFYEKQFVVKPEYIKNTKKQENQVIPPDHRLPFVYEKSGIGWGGYGTVDEVGIAPGYLLQETGASWPDVRAVACKRIETNETAVDYHKEVSNLQILKESLTSHDRIMLHLATIIHGPSFNILLPLARYGDLELFLNGGISYSRSEKGDKVYDPVVRFPKLNPDNLPRALMDECALLADGLRWLHDELRVRADRDLYCAHMDLKPSNVLVDHDPDSPVGRWMLSDFGISVFKASTGRQESGFLSIGDVHAELTLKTRAKRGHGPYQAPEVQPGGKKNVGRRSDVWSLGCIFSEVLAFALSNTKELRRFRAERRDQSNDYFYSPRATNSHLRVPSAPIEYELRLSVQLWLSTLHERFFQPRRWVECCVRVIKRILIVDPSKRPQARLTWELIRHVADHLHPLPTDAALDCPILYGDLSPLNSPGQQLGNHEIPAVAVSHIADDDVVSDTELESAQAESNDKFGKGKGLESRGVINGKQKKKSAEKEISVDSSRQYTETDDSKITTPVSKSYPRPRRPPPPIPTPRPLVKAPEQSNSRKRSGEHKLIEHRGSWGQQGSISSEGTEKALLAAASLKLPIPADAVVSIAVSSSNDTVGCLFSHCIYVYVIDVVNECHGAVMCMPLAKDKGWKCLTLAGPYVVAWGWSSSNSKRLIYLANRNTTPHEIPIPDHVSNLNLSTVALSEQGTVAFICDQKLKLFFLQSLNGDGSMKEDGKDAEPGYTFNQAAFNTKGDLLYAWSYGQNKDYLRVWKVSNGSLTWHHDGPYTAKHYGHNDVILHPYGSGLGCLIQTSEKAFFPAQFWNRQRDGSVVLPKLEIVLANFIIACICGDQSLITIEKGTMQRHARVYEYTLSIEGGNRTLPHSGKELAKLEKAVGKQCKTAVLRSQDMLTVVVCSMKGTVDIVKILL